MKAAKEAMARIPQMREDILGELAALREAMSQYAALRGDR